MARAKSRGGHSRESPSDLVACSYAVGVSRSGRQEDGKARKMNLRIVEKSNEFKLKYGV